jgi:hypothetical protein
MHNSASCIAHGTANGTSISVPPVERISFLLDPPLHRHLSTAIIARAIELYFIDPNEVTRGALALEMFLRSSERLCCAAHRPRGSRRRRRIVWQQAFQRYV